MNAICTRISCIVMGFVCGLASAQGTPPGSCTNCTEAADLGCFNLPMPSADYCAGGNVSISAGASVTLGGEKSVCGVTVQLSGTFSVGAAITLEAPPCSRCTAQMCFPNATVTKRTCTRWVCDEWMRSPGPGECGWFRVCVRGHYENYIVTKVNYGRPNVRLSCTDISCICRNNGFTNCKCETPSQNNNTPQARFEPAFPNGAQELAFHVPQLADIGNSRDPSPLNSIADLNLYQLDRLLDVIEDSIDDYRLDRADLELVSAFADGSVVGLSYLEWRAMAESAVETRKSSPLRADIDLDGKLDDNDLLVFLENLIDAESGKTWMSHADLDGDGMLTPLDWCIVFDVIVEH